MAKNSIIGSEFFTNDKVIISQSSRINCKNKKKVRVPLEKENNPLLSIIGKHGLIYNKRYNFTI